MDYKLTATVNRHFLVSIQRRWPSQLIRPYSGTLIARVYRATGAITKWTGITSRRVRGVFLGKGKP